MLGEQAECCTLGIVKDDKTGVVALAGLDSRRQSLTVETVTLSPVNEAGLGAFWGNGSPEKEDDPELRIVEQVICRRCPDPYLPLSVLLAVPIVHPDPDFAEKPPPLAVIERISPLLKVLLALVRLERVVFLATVENTNDPNSRIAVRRAPDTEVTGPQQWPLLLQDGVLMACTALLTGALASSTHAAAMGALIAAWPSSYSYWSSFGRMFSSMDIITALRAGQSRTYLHASSSEIVAVRWNSRRNSEILDEIALEHALAMQKHAHLSEGDALKMALVSLGRALGITVTCSSTRSDAVKSKYTEVWPPRQPFLWAMDKVCQQP
jgi:hypothetical protein